MKIFTGVMCFAVAGVIAITLVNGLTRADQERKSFLEKKNARREELAELRRDLGKALEQLEAAQERLQEKTSMIGRGGLTNGAYMPVFVRVIRTEDGEEFNVLFDGGNFPPILAVEKQ